jgi:hypothetical protein
MADNPYAQYAAPEAPRELTIRPNSANPYAEFAVAAPDTSMAQQAGVAARTLAPYATAAATGAAMGAPFGGVGAIPGAGLGLGALAASNLATGAYNLAAPMFGGSPVQTPSEAIRNVFAAGGVGRKPATSEQALGASALEGTLDALSLSGAGRVIGGKIGDFFSRRPVVQAVGGAGGAAVPTAMREYGGVENPYALAAGSLAGGITAAKTGSYIADKAQRLADVERRFVTGANIAPEAIKQRAQAAFDATDASGVVYDAPALSNMAQTVRQDLARGKFEPDSPRYTAVDAALARVDKKVAQGPQSIGNLHSLRQDLGHYLKDPKTGPDEARLIGGIVDNLDDFIANPRNATFSPAADVTSASNTLKGAISDWRRLSSSSQIEDLIERASRVEGTPFASALRTQFRTLANNPARMRRFDEAERETIKAIAEGATSSATLKAVSKLSPSLSAANMVRGGLLAAGTGAIAPATIPYALTAAGLAGAGATARGARNYFARGEANALAAAMLRGDVRAPVITPTGEMFQRGIPQAIMQAQQPSDYFFPENAMAR